MSITEGGFDSIFTGKFESWQYTVAVLRIQTLSPRGFGQLRMTCSSSREDILSYPSGILKNYIKIFIKK
jgi:hypothetical protein